MGDLLRPIKLFFGVLFLLFLFSLQTGPFLPPNSILPILALSLSILFFWILFERPDRPDGVILAAFAGFFWDLFSPDSLGYRFSVLIISAIALKFILSRYVRIPFSK